MAFETYSRFHKTTRSHTTFCSALQANHCGDECKCGGKSIAVLDDDGGDTILCLEALPDQVLLGQREPSHDEIVEAMTNTSLAVFDE